MAKCLLLNSMPFSKYPNPKKINPIFQKRQFAELAMKLNIKVIHCSERDTQVTKNPKEVDEFVNTWSVEGFFEEGIAPAELGWGTHEKSISKYFVTFLALPACAVMPPEGPKNQIFLENPGVDTWVKSWVPDYEIIGMVIRHGEAFSISDRLTVWEDGKAVYRYIVCH
jgi:homospermidine synthase